MHPPLQVRLAIREGAQMLEEFDQTSRTIDHARLAASCSASDPNSSHREGWAPSLPLFYFLLKLSKRVHFTSREVS